MKNIHASGKRKTAIARATLKQGSGLVRVNSVPIDLVEPKMSRLKLREPLILAGDVANKVNIDVTVFGGGATSQADASRLAIAKALVDFTKNDKLKEIFLSYDRNLLVADVRRKEAAKPNRHGKARSKIQKSYR
ncbi:30S ribosomal protein S9 [Candidatus Woesearchaeota archaeon]|jgi:small subunit ribosomal protein S9|nr:30S ribosomal protein S9 [Candidatus Woesearchaeota archaeon]MDP6648156.1 30S ribosomal protein S9 [Candidatus Woesearchaeota archaeon]|tara:strand:+ start:103594 stop:103995 length:402 start_codon:yes stop_codon:yes gene_type:complete